MQMKVLHIPSTRNRETSHRSANGRMVPNGDRRVGKSAPVKMRTPLSQRLDPRAFAYRNRKNDVDSSKLHGAHVLSADYYRDWGFKIERAVYFIEWPHIPTHVISGPAINSAMGKSAMGIYYVGDFQ